MLLVRRNKSKIDQHLLQEEILIEWHFLPIYTRDVLQQSLYKCDEQVFGQC